MTDPPATRLPSQALLGARSDSPRVASRECRAAAGKRKCRQRVVAESLATLVGRFDLWHVVEILVVGDF